MIAATMPTVFSMSATELTVTHVVSDIAQRLSLFGSETYYFIGIVSGSEAPTTPTSQFTFVINFID